MSHLWRAPLEHDFSQIYLGPCRARRSFNVLLLSMSTMRYAHKPPIELNHRKHTLFSSKSTSFISERLLEVQFPSYITQCFIILRDFLPEIHKWSLTLSVAVGPNGDYLPLLSVRQSLIKIIILFKFGFTIFLNVHA